jgi:hypothetical protein
VNAHQREVSAQARRSPLYEILTDPARGLLHIAFFGVWDLEMFEAFARDYARANALLAQSGGVTHSLIDASRFGFQSDEIAERFPSLLLSRRQVLAPRCAIVLSALVNKVQARAAGDMLDARYFKTVDAAVAWLFSMEA